MSILTNRVFQCKSVSNIDFSTFLCLRAFVAIRHDDCRTGPRLKIESIIHPFFAKQTQSVLSRRHAGPSAKEMPDRFPV
jgi:hypothetical protein